jgi:hypothetical protein
MIMIDISEDEPIGRRDVISGKVSCGKDDPSFRALNVPMREFWIKMAEAGFSGVGKA